MDEIMSGKYSKDVFSVLVIDDEEDIVYTVADTLNVGRYKVFKETDSKKAVERLQTEHYDIVITDLMMPNVNGMDIVEVLHKSDVDTKVIVLTGQATLESAIESVQLGVYDYLHKPIHSKTLLNVLKRATERLNLERTNKTLQKRNDVMLKNMVLLNKVSTILFQVTEIKDALEMVKDTLTEYFGFKKVVVFLENVQNGSFQPATTSLAGSNLNNFIFRQNTPFNGQTLDTNSVSIVDVQNGKIDLGGNSLFVGENFKHIVIFPLTYQEQTFGYLTVFQNREDGEFDEDTQMLVSMMCAQAAAVLYTLNGTNQKHPLENELIYFVREQIDEAKRLLTTISFALVRLEISGRSADFVIKDVLDNAYKIITENVKEKAEVFWQTKDTALLIMPDCDIFTAETLCKNIRDNIVNAFEAGNDTGIDAAYACASYPQVGETAAEILENLWISLLNEVGKFLVLPPNPEE